MKYQRNRRRPAGDRAGEAEKDLGTHQLPSPIVDGAKDVLVRQSERLDLEAFLRGNGGALPPSLVPLSRLSPAPQWSRTRDGDWNGGLRRWKRGLGPGCCPVDFRWAKFQDRVLWATECESLM